MDFQKILNEIINAAKTCFSKYFDASGRANRTEFWYFFIPAFLVSSLVNISSSGGVGLLSVALFIPTIMVAIRRLHDTDKSGFFVLAAMIPFVGWLALLYLCAQPGTEGENKYGDATEGSMAFEQSPLGDIFDDEPAPADAFEPTKNSKDFDYEDLKSDAEDVITEASEVAKTTTDRYGRDVKSTAKANAKKKSDFLKG